MPTILSRLRAAYPGVTVDFRPTPIGRFRSDIRRAVASGEIDVAVVLDTPFRLTGFAAAILTAEPISVIAATEHRLAVARTVVPRDLDGEPLLLPEAPDGCAYRGEFERQLAEAHVVTDRALEFASIETVKQCVVSGMGVSVVPGVAVEADVAAGRLVRLPWKPTFKVFTQIVWNARRVVGPAQQAFMTTAREAFASSPNT